MSSACSFFQLQTGVRMRDDTRGTASGRVVNDQIKLRGDKERQRAR